MRCGILFGLCLWGAIASCGAGAQAPGDAVVRYIDIQNPFSHHILIISPTAGATTVFSTLAASFPPGPIIPAPMNRGFMFTEQKFYTTPAYWLQYDGRAVTTLDTLGWVMPSDVLLDQDGDLWLQNGPFLQKMPPGGGPKTTLFLGTPLTTGILMEQELLTGDLILIGTSQPTAYLTRISRDLKVTSIKWPMPALPGYHRNLHTDYTDGSMILTWGLDVMRLDPRTGSILTLYRSGNPLYPVAGLDHDPFRGGFLNTEVGSLLRFDPVNRTQTTIFSIPGASGSNLEIVACYGSRMLTGRNPARHGATYVVDLAFGSAEAGKAYQAAAAFGPLRRIRVGQRWIPLDPDPLFFLSFAAPSIFEDFSGNLNMWGRAVLKVHFPNLPALRGRRIFLAAISSDASGVRIITEPFGVTIG